MKFVPADDAGSPFHGHAVEVELLYDMKNGFLYKIAGTRGKKRKG